MRVRRREDLWVTLIVYAMIGAGLVLAQIIALGPDPVLRQAGLAEPADLADPSGARRP